MRNAMKTTNYRILIIFIFLNTAMVFGQTEFTIHGVITNSRTKLPVDTSVYVTILTETKLSYLTFCNNNGEYSFHLPDSLNHKKVIVRALQDEKRIKKYSTGEPCSSICIEEGSFLLSSNAKRFTFNSDSSKTYEISFSLIPAIFDFSLPTLYFKKNESLIVQSDRHVSVDSAICDIKNLLKCRKTFVLELCGNCSPSENHKDILSLKRAQVLRDKLIAMGINPERLIAKGYSDKRFEEKSKDFEEWRPSHINKTDYEGQTVTFVVLRRDFQE
jgi:hypothetical protein